MSRISSISRTTNLLSSDRVLAQLRRTQSELLRTQNEISTGKTINKPSDNPARTSAVLLLQATLESRAQYERNLDHALSMLNNTDQALGDATTILREAQTIASSQVGVGSNTQTRKNQATVVDAQLQSLIDIGNRSVQGVPLFGGSSGAVGGEVFVDFLGGVRYLGTRSNIAVDTGLTQNLPFNSNGPEAFGALSSRVISLNDLDPQANAATALSDVNGTRGQGVQAGSITVNIDGTEMVIDLSNAATLGDVATRVNAAIAQVDPSAGTLNISGPGFALTAAAGHTIEIDDIGAGVTALDLGLTVTASGTTVAGGDIDPRLTELTLLSDLGAGIDFSGGLKITQGATTAIADFSSAVTVQDLTKEIQRLNLGLRMEVNADGTAMDLVSEVSGIELSISENGGTTAQDLGVRTFGVDTRLADFRHGLGVQTQEGDDFAIQLRDGRSFNVDVSGAGTVQDVLNRIRDAATTAGLTVGNVGDAGTDFNLGMQLNSNGFQFEDGTAGGFDFQVTQLGESLAATHLGIYPASTTGGTIQGEDVAKVKVNSVFTHLIELRDAMLNDDSSGITVAGTAIEQNVDDLTRARADVGVRAQRAEQQSERSSELGIAEQSLLSEVADADLTEVITRFTQLQQQLQASFQTAAQQLQLSLLDFLR